MYCRKYTETGLREAISSSYSRREVLRKLGIVAAGGNYQTLNKDIKNLNLDISHFTGQLWNKGKVIGPKRPIQDYLSNKFSITSHKLRLRLISEGFFEPKCSMCAGTVWLDGPIPLELDHINGDSSDNSLENLRLLCPNCHAMTPTYRGRNIKRTGAKKTKSKSPIFRATKIDWPPKEELEKLVWATPRSQLALTLGVSGSAIAKRCRKLEIPQPSVGYWQKRNAVKKNNSMSSLRKTS